MSPKRSTKERAWGTRYDTLESLPASSPTQRRSSPVPDAYNSATIVTPRNSLQHKSGTPGSTAFNAATTLRDSSVSTRSAPANTDHSELAQRLTEHCAIHSPPKAIQAVHGSDVSESTQREGPLSVGKGASSCWADQVADLDVYAPSGPIAYQTPSSAPPSGSPAKRPQLIMSSVSIASCGADHSSRAQDEEFSSPITLRLDPANPNVDWPQAIPPEREKTTIASGPPATLGHLFRDFQSGQHSPSGGVDPRTIFVGGLDPEGTAQWDEHRLRRIFNRHGDIESVQIVRPPTKRTCFAFVQFVNPESANRAVRDEHNRVHNGRPLRVQLRERNPPLNTNWRLERGRGRTRLGGPFRPHQDVLEYHGARSSGPIATQTPLETHPAPAPVPVAGSHGASSPETDEPVPGAQHVPTHGGLRRQPSYGTVESSASSVSSGTTKVPSVHHYGSHGAPSTTTSPGPPTSTSSMSSALAPFPHHHMSVSYFPPQPWLQPYHPPYPYPMPVMPGYTYPGYAYPHIPPAPSFTGRETGVLSSSTSNPALACAITDNGDRAANDQHSSHVPLQGGTQPPLCPTGFIQSEHGTLIPVYQREALDQYMAGTYPGETPAQTGTPLRQPPPVSAPGVAPWPTAPYPFYGAPYPAVAANHPPPVQGGRWFVGGPPHPVPPFLPGPQQSAPPQQYALANPAPAGGIPRAGPAPNVRGRHPSGQRGGFHPRRFNGRGYDNTPGGNAFRGNHNVRFPDQVGPPTHAFGWRP